MAPHWRILLFFGVVTLVLATFSLYVHRRVVQHFAPPAWLSRTLLGILLLGIGAALLSRFWGTSMPELSAALGALGGAVTLGVLLSSVLLVPHEAVHWSLRLRRKEPDAPGALAHPGRRSFLAQTTVGGAVSLGMGASAYGTLFGRHDHVLETVPVRLAKLPKALDGFSIVQLSDLHVGLYIGDDELRRALSLVAQAKPDIVVLTGDLIDHDARFAPVLGRFVRALAERAPRGVFAIPGNHDHYAGVAHVLSTLRKAGAEVLLNRHVLVGDKAAQLAVAGVDDVAAPRYGGLGPRLDRTFAGLPESYARVLLSHNPAYFPSSYQAADLSLSGHTHGGQITLFINPAELVLSHGFVRGLYHHHGSQLYVNRGFGTAGPPARVGSPPEVTKLVLTSA